MFKIIRQIFFLSLSVLFFFTTLTCKRSPIEPNGFEMLWLNFEDASCTEAWFNLKLNNLPKPVRVDVFRENYLSKSFTIAATNDTLFYIENLLPKQRYKVYVKVKSSDGKEYKSTEVNFETMDTTSHEFTWQIFEFGEQGNSVLYDVAIIDENNIWAVGEIYMLDSLGRPDPNAYNAVHWNGTKWELKRIYFPTVCGSTSLSSYPAGAIFVFDDGQIWISSTGDKIARLQNGVQIDKFCLPSNVSMSINKLWGSSSNDLYAVGNNGNIAHWDGRKWTKIESGTTLPIMDIYGAQDPRTGRWEILCVSADQSYPGHSQIIAIENKSAREVFTHPFWEPWGIWFVPGRRYITVGDGLWESNRISGTWIHNTQLPNWFQSRVYGQGLNDIVVSGSYWLLAHYNGISWKTYFPRTAGALGGIILKGNLLVAVGYVGNKAVLIKGRR